jgi:hypothetical protein
MFGSEIDNSNKWLRTCRARQRPLPALDSVSRFLLLVSSFLAALCSVPKASADKPVLDGIFPLALSPGSTNEVLFQGKISPWPPEFWSSRTDLRFVASTNKGKARIELPSDAPAGPALIRVYNQEGTSEPLIVYVSSGPELIEIEPNNSWTNAQPIASVPTSVNARLEKSGDVDSFKLQLTAGQWLNASAECYLFIGKADLVLRLVDTNGVQLAWNHDFITIDPSLSWQAKEDCTVVLQCFGFAYPADSEIRLKGGDATSYRLQIKINSEEPQICPPAVDQTTNDAAVFPQKFSRSIQKTGEEHRFPIELKKNESIDLRIRAAAFGSPLDAWLKVENSKGKIVAKNDDAHGSADPHLEFTAPEDGLFQVVVGSTLAQVSARHCYELTIAKATPSYEASLPASSMELAPGKTNELKIAVKRLFKHTNEVRFELHGLPPGVSASSTNAGPKETSVTMQIIANQTAKPFQGPITIASRDAAENNERIVPFVLTTRSENNGVPGGYTTLHVTNLPHLWLTVTTNKPAP